MKRACTRACVYGPCTCHCVLIACLLPLKSSVDSARCLFLFLPSVFIFFSPFVSPVSFFSASFFSCLSVSSSPKQPPLFPLPAVPHLFGDLVPRLGIVTLCFNFPFCPFFFLINSTASFNTLSIHHSKRTIKLELLAYAFHSHSHTNIHTIQSLLRRL